MALSLKQSLFVSEYLVDGNATQAAIRAGYSAKTAGSIGEENLKKPEIAAEIKAALERRNQRVEVKADDVLRELLRLAMVDIGEAYDENNNLKKLHDMPPGVRRSIAQIETHYIGGGEDGAIEVKKVKFNDKTKALELLGKHLKLFTDKLEVSGKMTLEQLVEQASKK